MEIRRGAESVMKFVTRDYRWNLHQASTPTRALSEGAMMAEIGRDLRSMYNGLLKEPLPDNLAGIVRELDKRERPAPLTSAPLRRTASPGSRPRQRARSGAPPSGQPGDGARASAGSGAARSLPARRQRSSGRSCHPGRPARIHKIRRNIAGPGAETRERAQALHVSASGLGVWLGDSNVFRLEGESPRQGAGPTHRSGRGAGPPRGEPLGGEPLGGCEGDGGRWRSAVRIRVRPRRRPADRAGARVAVRILPPSPCADGIEGWGAEGLDGAEDRWGGIALPSPLRAFDRIVRPAEDREPASRAGARMGAHPEPTLADHPS
jgi:hypothetical protein